MSEVVIVIIALVIMIGVGLLWRQPVKPLRLTSITVSGYGQLRPGDALQVTSHFGESMCVRVVTASGHTITVLPIESSDDHVLLSLV